MKKLASNVNVLLGAAIVMLTGTGCKAQKSASDNTPRGGERPRYNKEKIEERIVCMYGIPAEVLREQEIREREETDVPVAPSDSITNE